MEKKKSNTGKLLVILILLAAVWLAAGTFGMLRYRDYMEGKGLDEKKQVEEDKTGEAPESDNIEDPEESEDSYDEDEEDLDDEDIDDEDEPEEDEDTDDEEDDEDDDDDEEEHDYVTMVVSAPDNFAAVRSGRGTQYQEVGRITNGNKVALTDLQNGWYRIAKGKYKGYYAHQSSFVPE